MIKMRISEKTRLEIRDNIQKTLPIYAGYNNKVSLDFPQFVFVRKVLAEIDQNK